MTGARILAGTVAIAVASICLSLAAFEAVEIVMGGHGLNVLAIVVLLSGTSAAALAAYLRKDAGLLLRFALFPTNLASGLLVLGVISPKFFGRQTPPAIAAFCAVLLIVCLVASFKSQLRAQSRHDLNKP